MDNEVDGGTNCNGELENILKGFVRKLEDLEIGDYQNCHIVEVGKNTEKSPEDLRRLAVTLELFKWVKYK